ncbi:nucleotide-diphospho-sugar transferase [Hymenobacter sp. HSC-4F20]|uniref:nucleotide-diphospho-sugar transferase n=1 Tax=Hymenobacter sp. HSC-4F20 TaxID=2864135 RepID=UPI001C735660|nr:nucleotide-diphospho-sugar transferase [Hymenobacter sp. HSC-4F20]MBX0290427.1 nucleotide-diphospho-sugar transferase [Hymenobacter sp. HSC-4F20]
MLSTPDLSAAAPEGASPLQAPVLLLLFNRPDTTRRVFEAVRRARPTRLYVAADGPRPTHPDDAAKCAAARAVVQDVDWPCEVFTLFRTSNLNCGVGPASALDWFFRREEEGIILEDDCVPAPSFFPFCEELLARYRHDTRVLHIGGNNFSREARGPQPAGADSYYFSTQVNSWGWATWRRAWQLYDFHLSQYHQLAAQGKLRGLYSSWLENRYRLSKIRSVVGLPQPPDVWDYQWHFAIVAHSGLCVVPAVNLVGNIGFGEQGTHTLDATDEFANVPTTDVTFPLRHPAFVLADRRRDQQRFREFLWGRVEAKARRLLARALPRPAAPAAALPGPPPPATPLDPAPLVPASSSTPHTQLV